MPAVKSANLCWGQRYMWLRVHRLPPRQQHETHVVMRFAIPEGLTLAGCRALLTHFVRRHEALRTTYHVEGPEQRVHPPGPFAAVVATTERDGTPAPAEVIDRLRTEPFDLAHEWPMRACLITRGGAPRQVVLVFNHLAVDVWTLGEFERELGAQATGLATRRPVTPPPVRHQPADLARYETSADAAVTAAGALAYWRDEIARLPADPFATRRAPAPPMGPEPGPEPEPAGAAAPRPPAATHATLISPALLAAGRRVAARHGVWPSLVHMTAYTAMTAAYTGEETVSHLVFVGNRESHPFTDVLTCMFSPVPVRVDCSGDPPFGELLRRAAAALDRARAHAYLPYDELVELLSREGSRRGRAVRLGSEVNFIKQSGEAYGGGRTALTWHPAPEAWAHYGGDAYLRVDEWPDAVALSLQASAAVLDAAAVEGFLRGHEALVLACDDSAAEPRVSDAAALAAFAPRDSGGPATPSGRGDRSDWTDRDGATAGPALTALTEAVCRANGLAAADPSGSYVLAGGRVLRIPGVLADLAARGWSGLSLGDLAGPAPLGALAGRLVSPSALMRLGVKSS
ncbi:hypothetical protein JOL79_29550 [Microbispora sp. RL4-1S]|uniref:Condensation domain-containing protein n=1 Tax=Microbispora oryzae TaxID=2806554 RepID=A0A940WN40_9ACTN|nr:condensation domain-containing protein [Microbispora oryzae]MBP2707933.1 hypothetical protein [Microbispora oryzae]